MGVYVQIFVPLFDQLTKAYHEWDGEDDMVIPTRVALMFVDWTDPFRAQCVSRVRCVLRSTPILTAYQGGYEGPAQGA